MSNYVSKKIVLNNLELPPSVEILYTSWLVTLVSTGEEVYYIEEDYDNLTSKVFNNVFEIGKKYSVTMNMVRTDGPTVHTTPLEILIEANEDIYNTYPMPSVVDTPLVSLNHSMDGIPTNLIEFIGSDISVLGNAVIDKSDWWLTNDNNDVIWTSLNDEVNRQSIIVSGVELNPNRVYTMHLVYTGTNNDKSGVGNITFKPANLSMLDIDGDLNSVYYGFDLNTKITAVDMGLVIENFDYELMDSTGTVVNTGTNTTGLITISKTLLTINHSEYRLRVKVTIAGIVYGWRVYSLNPREFSVLSTDISDYDFEYKNESLEADITISYLGNGFTGEANPNGRTYQLPNGDILMLSSKNTIGRYTYDNNHKVLRYMGDLDIDGLVYAELSNDSIIQMFNNGILLVATKTSTGYILSIVKYEPISNKFTYITNTTITSASLKRTEFYSFYQDTIIFLVNNASSTSLSTINSNGVITLLLNDVTPSYSNGNLIKIDNDTYLVTYGSTSGDMVASNTAKLIKFNNGLVKSTTIITLPVSTVVMGGSASYQNTVLKNGCILLGTNSIVKSSNTGVGVKFNGTNQYIKCCEISDIETFSFCISYKHSTASDKIISGVIDSINQERDYIGINVNGKLGIGLGGTNYNTSGRFITRDLVVDQVYNLCLTKEGDIFKFYVDGVLELTGIETDWIVPSGYVALGAIYNTSTSTVSNYYNTVLANAFFTSEVLNQDQVLFMHTKPHRFIYKNSIGTISSDAGIDLSKVQTYLPMSENDSYVRDMIHYKSYLTGMEYKPADYNTDDKSLNPILSTRQVSNGMLRFIDNDATLNTPKAMYANNDVLFRCTLGKTYLVKVRIGNTSAITSIDVKANLTSTATTAGATVSSGDLTIGVEKQFIFTASDATNNYIALVAIGSATGCYFDVDYFNVYELDGIYPIVNYTTDCRTLGKTLPNTLQSHTHKRDELGLYKSISDGYEVSLPLSDTVTLVEVNPDFFNTVKPVYPYTIRLNNGNVIMLNATTSKALIYK